MTTGPRDAPLRFATYLAPNMTPVYRFLADRIGQRLGRPGELVAGRSFDQFDAHELREERVLKVSGVVDSGSEQGDDR